MVVTQRQIRAALTASVLAAAGSFPASAAAERVVVSTTIQQAVDDARPGDVVVVPPGRYHESVTIAKSDITIQGSRGAILDASGFAVGIRASSGPNVSGPDGFPVCPQPLLHDLAVEGLRIENARVSGVLFRGVRGFRLQGGTYRGGAYSVFPVCSQHGRIDGNRVEGTTDGAIYVGDSHDVAVTRNHATASTIGIEIENSTAITVSDNVATQNTSGIVAFVLPRLPIPRTEDVLITRNVVTHNNMPNPVAPGAGPQGAIPTGTGILALGVDRAAIRSNVVIGNDSGGIALVSNPFAPLDPRVDPAPDHNAVRQNVVLGNGGSPDPLRSPVPGADLIHDGSGTGNCFAANVFQTAFPTGIQRQQFPCSQ